MAPAGQGNTRKPFGLALVVYLILAGPTLGADAKIHVILWFDTEDYLLPVSDDAALWVADMLTREQIRATFKVVGEKARTLEKRGRKDVIEALKKHEIGYHSNFHSTQPSPAMYLAHLGWDEGVAECDRREGPGVEDVTRIFGVAPSCYGQPGSSWGPQVFGAMKKWGMEVYLDAGKHVGLDDKPHFFCGMLTLYRLEHTFKTKLGGPKDLEEAEQKFLAARKKLLDEGGGVVSTYLHPCELVHKEFWDGVNFRSGANPPRSQWKLPAQKTPQEIKVAQETFTNYIRFIKRFPEVRFITATEAFKKYRDQARGRKFTSAELKTVAGSVTENISYFKGEGYALSASETFALLNDYVAERVAGRQPESLTLASSPLGPTNRSLILSEAVGTDWDQFARTAGDVADFLKRHGRVPTVVWLGSVPVPPEAYLRALAEVAKQLLDDKQPGEKIDIKPAKLAAADYVAADGPDLWTWVIFPRNFRAPALMELARRQAWTIKPALLNK